MWAQLWGSIISRVKPYPEVADTDVTSKMLLLGYTPLKIFKLAEEFYVSIGLFPMTKTFWNKSLIQEPTDGRVVICHGTAFDFNVYDDFRHMHKF